MIQIKELKILDIEKSRAIATGYTSEYVYEITKEENAQKIVFSLIRKKLHSPLIKEDMLDEGLFKHYKEIISNGFCYGVYAKNEMIGIALAEKEDWNNSLWIWEFHIDEKYRRMGLGTKLMNKIEEIAKDQHIRIMICETQNNNVRAINFYRKIGFEVEGIDLSYYSNQDIDKGEIAIFMKKKLSKYKDLTNGQRPSQWS